MCVIIVQPPGQKIPRETFRKAWQENPDGGGLMFPQPDITLRKTVGVVRSLNKEQWLWDQYEAWHAKIGASDYIVAHFRIGTSGRKDLKNVHPWRVPNSGIAFVHNGIVPYQMRWPHISDTGHLARNLTEDLVVSGTALQTLELTSSKFVFMLPDGSVKIVNEGMGTWSDGLWFSNMSWKYSYSSHEYWCQRDDDSPTHNKNWRWNPYKARYEYDNPDKPRQTLLTPCNDTDTEPQLPAIKTKQGKAMVFAFIEGESEGYPFSLMDDVGDFWRRVGDCYNDQYECRFYSHANGTPVLFSFSELWEYGFITSIPQPVIRMTPEKMPKLIANKTGTVSH